MAFGLPPITDFCFLVEDIERSVTFYRNKLGFTLRTRAEGFADFKNKNVALALWEIDHIAANIGISNKRSGPGVHKAVAAIELEKPDEIDVLYAQLLARGVEFVSPPKDFSWRARCVYFTDPDENLWEIYAWLDGRRFGEVTE
jgi:catechol 2,3-dioxygenase-like lactoylglutathione lyase family enzyme